MPVEFFVFSGSMLAGSDPTRPQATAQALFNHRAQTCGRPICHQDSTSEGQFVYKQVIAEGLEYAHDREAE